jgi:hypothetical protein
VWLLPAVLALQAVLSLRLVWANTAFEDEATYLNAGHAVIAGWLHGAPMAPFSDQFSGAPVLYPPLGAIADSLGGLVGARLLSLCFMLVTTFLLWSAAERLLGQAVAFLTAITYIAVGPTQFLGAFATYDALALTLLAAAAWCALGIGSLRGSAQGSMVIATIALLAMADATKYAATLWDVVVIVLGGLSVAREQGARRGVASGLILCAGTAGTLLAAVALVGRRYQKGIELTTIDRQSDHIATLELLFDSVRWIGVVVLLALAGSVIIFIRERHGDHLKVLTLWVLTAASFLAPAEQIRIHTLTSLFKHVGFGAWFATIPAGYALSVCFSEARRRKPVLAVFGVALAVMMSAGIFEAYQHYTSWPNSGKVVRALRPFLERTNGPWLAEDDSVLIYYSHTPQTDWHNTFDLTFGKQTGAAAFTAAVRDHYYRMVVLSFTDTIPLDLKIQKVLYQTPGYHQIAVIPEGLGGFGHEYHIWYYNPPKLPPSPVPRHGRQS